MRDNSKNRLRAIFDAGVAAAMPDKALSAHVMLSGNAIIACGARLELAGRIIALGAGKGAAPMARAAENLLGEYLDKGLVVVKYGHRLPLSRMRLVEAGHPVPDAAGLRAASELLEIAGQCGQDDVLLCLFTGGASALLPAPAPGITLADLQAATSLLLASGASIDELNAIRKHISLLGGGQLARAANGARILSVIVSDVIGDSLETIASGPTAPDPYTYEDCLAILKKYGLMNKIPPSVLRHLRDGAAGNVPETPKPDDPIFANVRNIIVASNGQAVRAAAAKARQLGYEPEILTEPMHGEARHMAALLAAKAKSAAAELKPGDKPVCLLAGGETTVAIKGSGKGGRNQEMALAAAIELADTPGIAALFAGTDGTDGPTDAAGGFALRDTAARIGNGAAAMLAANDSYNALARADDLLVTGPTLTNVMDLAIFLIDAPQC